MIEICEAARNVGCWPLLDRDPKEGWASGHVVLIGDACHAMLPYQAQGAAQAIQDGLALGKALEGATFESVPQRLSQYEQMRVGKANEVQMASRSLGAVLHLDDGPEQQKRDLELYSSTGGDSQTAVWSS